ncbi:glutamine synthetase family protein [Reinekea sp.]|jgi:glutamine synthetase|uniref:glutamine synthetase family protein n=1 Tax=Reinekea sp. TaxID=1970455 RepID=UPI002A8294C0|nr:glutamine synthetase family protein [Reinekea sp.]
MTVKEATDFLEAFPDVTTIELLICDLNGVLRGKRIERELLERVFTVGFYLPGSVMSLDASGSTVEDAGLGMDQGDRDRLCFPIAGTLSIVPWHESGDRAQALCTMFEEDTDTPFFADPRQVLVQAVERFSQMGFEVGIAMELEFYLLDAIRDGDGNLQPPKPPGSSRRMRSNQIYSMDDLDEYDFFIRDVIDTAHQQNIPADTVIAEYAPGQFEVNLNYGSDILKAVDHSVLLKRLIASVATKYKMEATFMAKPYIQEAGSGLHLHLSLLKDGVNIFASEDPTTNPYMRNAIGGLLDMADSTQGFLAPTINSYRRLAPDAFAPTTKTWGYDNRTVALRIPSGSIDSTRIEHRMCGADTNPYLATTVLLAGVTEGIMNKIEPPTPIDGNAYEQDQPSVADNQRDALRNMQKDARVNKWFGKDFVDVYQSCKWSELRMFEQQVTPMEYELLLPYI